MSLEPRSQWRSRLGFILAAAGSAVGLGNIWRFPYIVGENGGSLFIGIYLLCVLALGLPILIAEILLGKASRRNPVGAFKTLAGPKTSWQVVGFMGVFGALVILSFYGVVAGWCLDFIWKSMTGVFQPGHGIEEVISLFDELTGDPVRQSWCLAIFLLMCVGIVVCGVQGCLQRWCQFLMPALILILLVLLVYAFNQPGSAEGLRFMLEPQPEELTGESILAAMGQCFFSLSLGMGALLTYGSYLRREDRVPGSATWVVGMDTVIALMAGMVVFPLIFAFGKEPAQGPGLVFVTLPTAFLQMPGGTFVALGFFVLLLFAALTSGISLLEVVTAYFVDEYGMSRRLAACLFGTIIFLIGVGCTYGGGYFDFLEHLASNYLLPLGALFIALFAGWRMDVALARSEFAGTWYAWFFHLWLICIRVISPALVALVFVHSTGLFERLFGE